jgi:Rrf2 family protein
MKYSQSTELAIDSLYYMAAHPQVLAFAVEDIAQAQQVSVSYLAKVFQQLVKAGLLRSQRGAKGGYTLGRPANQITLHDVAVVFEGSSALYDCSAYTKRCRGSKCLVRATFGEAERRMQEVLKAVSLQDVVDHNALEANRLGKQSDDGHVTSEAPQAGTVAADIRTYAGKE